MRLSRRMFLTSLAGLALAGCQSKSDPTWRDPANTDPKLLSKLCHLPPEVNAVEWMVYPIAEGKEEVLVVRASVPDDQIDVFDEWLGLPEDEDILHLGTNPPPSWLGDDRLLFEPTRTPGVYKSSFPVYEAERAAPGPNVRASAILPTRTRVILSLHAR